MEFKNKIIAVVCIMAFSLFYALSPSRPVERATVTTSEVETVTDDLLILPKDIEKINLKEIDKFEIKGEGDDEEDDEEEIEPGFESIPESEYPVYDIPQSVDSAESQVDLTPEQLSRHIYKDVMIGRNLSNLFVDGFQFESAPRIKVLPESRRVKYRRIVLEHERYYRTATQAKLYVPRLRKSSRLSVPQFWELFLKRSQPVIIPFEAMRHLNFTTKARTLKELLELYPNHENKVYKYGVNKDEEIDLGPALASLQYDKELVKTKAGRNYPRNLKIKPSAMSKLEVQLPAFIPEDTRKFKMMQPSLWFGSSSSSTPFHSDCCDNYAMMISGTKRWTISPPSESRILGSKCTGGLCWATKLPHPDIHAQGLKEKKLRDNLQKIDFDLNAGEVLYLPCGWWHHVENIGPTIMVNFWTKDKAFFLKEIDGEVSEADVQIM